jgi:hypothetical protein
MARLAKILKTDVMADLDMKALAQVLRAQGRGRDTVLAHITPKEAELLKKRGGSGTINPTTGLPEFQDGDYFDFSGSEAYQAGTPETFYGSAETYYPPVDPYAGQPAIEVGGEAPAAASEFLTPVSAPAAAAPAAAAPAAPETPAGQMPTSAAVFRAPQPEHPDLTPSEREAAAEEAATGQRGYFSRLGTSLEKQLSDPATLARLGLGLGTGALGLLQQQRAAAGAKQSKREMANIGAPYRAQGQELIEQARRGEMSPASMQAYQAAQAQIAQQTARQGGVGAAQGAATLERLRAQLLQNQYNLGLNVANIGDRYLAGAIQTGQQANQQLMTATNQFYSTLGSMLSGPTGQAVATAVRA